MSKLFRFSLLIICTTMLFACGQKESEDALRNKAATLINEEKYDEASQVFETLIKEYPEGEYTDEAWHKLAFMQYNHFHDFNKAIEYYKQLIEKFPESDYAAQARFMIGYIYANDLQQYDEAQGAYEEFLAKHPDHELAESVKWELEHLGEDVNMQLEDLFGDKKTNGETNKN